MNKEDFHCPNKIQPLELANTHYIRYEMIEEEQFCHILIYQIQNIYKCTWPSYQSTWITLCRADRTTGVCGLREKDSRQVHPQGDVMWNGYCQMFYTSNIPNFFNLPKKKNVNRDIFGKKWEWRMFHSSILKEWSVFVTKYKLTPVTGCFF